MPLPIQQIFLPFCAGLDCQLSNEDFPAAVGIAQAEHDQGRPDVVVGSSRGGAVAMNIDSGDTPPVLLCPARKTWGVATIVKPNTIILHSKADETVPFADSEELLRNSDRLLESLIEVGTEHRLADPNSLRAMLKVCEIQIAAKMDHRFPGPELLQATMKACEPAKD